MQEMGCTASIEERNGGENAEQPTARNEKSGRAAVEAASRSMKGNDENVASQQLRELLQGVLADPTAAAAVSANCSAAARQIKTERDTATHLTTTSQSTDAQAVRVCQECSEEKQG